MCVEKYGHLFTCTLAVSVPKHAQEQHGPWVMTEWKHEQEVSHACEKG
jgi:hypothetical protein